jgi:hypothetical protein
LARPPFSLPVLYGYDISSGRIFETGKPLSFQYHQDSLASSIVVDSILFNGIFLSFQKNDPINSEFAKFVYKLAFKLKPHLTARKKFVLALTPTTLVSLAAHTSIWPQILVRTDFVYLWMIAPKIVRSTPLLNNIRNPRFYLSQGLGIQGLFYNHESDQKKFLF